MTRLRRLGFHLTALLAAVSVLALPGCGDDSDGGSASDSQAVSDVMSSLDEASRDGNGARICEELFTPKLAKSVSTSSASGSCATEVKAKLFSPDSRISVESIAVPDGSSAIATVTEANGNTSKVFLVKNDGEWRIRSVVPA
jgi:hypothetical protein